MSNANDYLSSVDFLKYLYKKELIENDEFVFAVPKQGTYSFENATIKGENVATNVSVDEKGTLYVELSKKSGMVNISFFLDENSPLYEKDLSFAEFETSFKIVETEFLSTSDLLDYAKEYEKTITPLTYDYIKESVLGILADQHQYKYGEIGNVLYENASGKEGIDSFVSVTLKTMLMQDYKKMSVAEFDERIANIVDYCGDFESTILAECSLQFIKEDVSRVFLNRDASVLLNPSLRSEMDFTKFVDEEGFVFEIENNQDGILRIGEMMDGTIEADGAEVLQPALGQIVEHAYNMGKSISVDINRLTGEISASLHFSLDVRESGEDVSFPIELTANERNTLITIVEEEIGEPIKMTEQALKRNSFLKESSSQTKSEKIKTPAKNNALSKNTQETKRESQNPDR